MKTLLGDQVRAIPAARPLSELPASPFPFSNAAGVSLAPWLPRSAEDCFSLLEVFYSHVEPMTRLVHESSLTRRLIQYVRETYGLQDQEAAPDPTSQIFEPLAFAIFYSAINSLAPELGASAL